MSELVASSRQPSPAADAQAEPAQARSTPSSPAEPVSTSRASTDPAPAAPHPGRKLFGILVTLATLVVACFCGWIIWQAYVGAPWTRDGTVRVYVVTMAPEVAGQVVGLPVVDNQFVHKGDVIMQIDPRDYKVAVDVAQAQVDQAKADLANKRSQAERRLQLTDLSTTPEVKEQYAAAATMAAATLEARQADLEQAKVNLDRVDIRSTVNGWITNLETRVGNYATTGMRSLSIVDADSFWVDGYFEETVLAPIREGDRARVKLLGYKAVLTGRVNSLSRGITVQNADPGQAGLASVNPIFTWVRLAQRVPVRIQLDPLPPGVRLVAGMTATVEIEPGTSTDPHAKPIDPDAAPHS